MSGTDAILNAHAQYYATYRLSIILNRANFLLSSIEMVKESYLVEGDTYDFLVAKLIVVDKSSGRILYPKIYPRFFTDDDISGSFVGKCDDMGVRFSIFFDKSGFFSPLWTELFKDGRRYKPEGLRMDWDKYNNVAPTMTQERYYWLERNARNSTALQNDEVVLRTLPRWLYKASVDEDDD